MKRAELSMAGFFASLTCMEAFIAGVRESVLPAIIGVAYAVLSLCWVLRHRKVAAAGPVNNVTVSVAVSDRQLHDAVQHVLTEQRRREVAS